jgi:hypothetical protein
LNDRFLKAFAFPLEGTLAFALVLALARTLAAELSRASEAPDGAPEDTSAVCWP